MAVKTDSIQFSRHHTFDVNGSASPISFLPSLLSAACVLFAATLILASYSHISETWDEPAHIGTGMEWLARGTYTLDLIDPPLPRVSVALGPYLLGSRPAGHRDPWLEGNAILDASPNPYKTLVAARLGVLPYFLIAAFLTWRMTKRWLGSWPALMATALFCTCPPVLAHAGLATTDMAFAAMFLFATDRLWLVIEAPGWLNALLAGIGIGLACLSKLSGAPYVSLCTIILLSYRFFVMKKWVPLKYWAIAIIAVFFTIWAGFHFEVDALGSQDPAAQMQVQHLLAKLGPLRKPASLVANHFPAKSYAQSIRAAAYLKAHPPLGYLFGRLYSGGLWYFFLGILLVKTPVPFLLLAIPGMFFAAGRLWKMSDGFALVTLCGIVIPILFNTLSHVNLGVRHVLVVYPFLAMVAALTCTRLWNITKANWVAPSAAAALLAWQIASCLYVSPEFLTYLNEPAAPYTGYLCADSDLDWGQDIGYLGPKLKQLHANNVWIAYSGMANLNREDLPAWHRLADDQQAKGWVVLSETWARWYPQRYAWLEQKYRVGTAGKTLRIYYVP